MNKNLFLSGIVLLMLFVPIYANAEPKFNEDGYCDEVGNNHDDNKASNKKFKEYLNKHICELSDCIDDESCEGKVTNYKEFKKTEAYKTSNVLITDCFKERNNLPPALQDYEIQKCAQGDY